MAKRSTSGKKTSKRPTGKSVTGQSKITRAATTAAGQTMKKASKSTKRAAGKPSMMRRARNAVVSAEKTVASKVKNAVPKGTASKMKQAVRSAGMATATAVGAAMGAAAVVKDITGGGNGKAK